MSLSPNNSNLALTLGFKRSVWSKSRRFIADKSTRFSEEEENSAKLLPEQKNVRQPFRFRNRIGGNFFFADFEQKSEKSSFIKERISNELNFPSYLVQRFSSQKKFIVTLLLPPKISKNFSSAIKSYPDSEILLVFANLGELERFAE